MKKFNFRKIGAKASAFAMAAALSMSFATPVHAAEATVTAPGTSDCEVSTTISSNYNVKLPLSINLTQTTEGIPIYSGESNFSPSGVIGGDKVLQIIIPTKVNLSDSYGNDKTATVTCSTGTVNDSEGTITCKFHCGGSLSGSNELVYNGSSYLVRVQVSDHNNGVAGTFTGTMQFEIALEDR